MDSVTLTKIFESNKKELVEKLNNLSLPQDAQKVQEIVADFLSSLFESDGTYRQNLIQSEDYILQAALQLLQTQQKITAEVVASIKNFKPAQQESAKPASKQNLEYTPILGTGVGAIAGSLLGTWGAVCGAIAGTAVAIYCSTKSNKTTNHKTPLNAQPASPINVEIFSNIVEKVCENIDNLMQTYRVQVKRIENLYTQAEQPSLLNECSILFEQIANVYKAVEANKEQTPPKVISAIEMLIESLENYDLTIKNGKVVNK